MTARLFCAQVELHPFAMVLGRHARGGDRKQGTTNQKARSKRDKRAADAAAAEQQAVAEAEAAMEEVEASSEDEQPDHVRDAAQEERSRQLMVWWHDTAV